MFDFPFLFSDVVAPSEENIFFFFFQWGATAQLEPWPPPKYFLTENIINMQSYIYTQKCLLRIVRGKFSSRYDDYMKTRIIISVHKIWQKWLLGPFRVKTQFLK